MTSTPQEVAQPSGATTTPRGTDRGVAARKHLWKHFTRESAYGEGHEVPIIVRGDGAYIWDDQGRRYLDGLAGLFVVQAGHGRRVLAEAAAKQAADLAFFPLWSYAHPAAIDLAERLAHLAPGDLNRVFFTTGGSEAVESAWKLARSYFKKVGQPLRHKVVSRYLAYHGTSLGALSITELASVDDAATQVYEQGAVPVGLIGEIRQDTLRTRLATVNHAVSSTSTGKAGYEQAVADEDAAVDAAVAAYEPYAVEPELLAEFEQAWAGYRDVRDEKLLPASRANELWLNRGAGSDGVPRFEDVARTYGVADEGYSTQAAFLDYDRDGDLDLLVINNSPRPVAG